MMQMYQMMMMQVIPCCVCCERKQTSGLSVGTQRCKQVVRAYKLEYNTLDISWAWLVSTLFSLQLLSRKLFFSLCDGAVQGNEEQTIFARQSDIFVMFEKISIVRPLATAPLLDSVCVGTLETCMYTKPYVCM